MCAAGGDGMELIWSTRPILRDMRRDMMFGGWCQYISFYEQAATRTPVDELETKRRIRS